MRVPYSIRSIIVGYSIAIAAVLMVLAFTFYNLRSQEQKLNEITRSRLVLQQLEPGLVDMQEFAMNVNDVKGINQTWFTESADQLQADSVLLAQLAENSKEDKADYLRLTVLIHQMKEYGRQLMNSGETNVSSVTRNAVNEDLRLFKELVLSLEAKHRIFLSQAYGVTIMLTRRTFTFVAILSTVLLIALLLSFRASYRDSRNRAYYQEDLLKEVNEKTAVIKASEERYRSLAELVKDSEKNLRSVLTSAVDDFYVIDKNYRVTLINTVAEKNLKTAWGRKVSMGDYILDVFPNEKKEQIKANYDKVFTGKRIEYEIPHEMDGESLWLSVNYMPVRDADGVIIGAYISTKDITRRKMYEEELRRSEERYRSLIEQASDFIMITDIDGKFIDVNSSLSKAFGYSKDELMQTTVYKLIDANQLKEEPMRFDLLLQGIPILRERRMISKDGSIIEVEANVKMLPDGRVLAIARDIRERKLAEQELIKARELADKVVDSLPGVFYLYDEVGNFIRWNRQLEVVSGYSAAEVATMQPAEFFSEKERAYLNQKIKDVFLYGVSDAEASVVTKTGEEIPYYFKAVHIYYEGKSCLLGTGIDIAERVKFEGKLQESVREIRQLTEYLQNIREEERTNIAREIHDELGQQLTVLKMDISWLSKRIEGAEDAVQQKMKGLKEMLDSTVKTVRKIASELRPSLLDDLGLIAAMEWHLKEFGSRSGIKTAFAGMESEEPVLSLPVKTGLYRIFQESLTNVARHSKAKKVNISLQKNNGSIVLKIDDDGVGFDSEKAATRMTLGLLGMKERTMMMGGNYKIKSSPGKGTIVEVSVPVPASVHPS